jgi:uncharacterized protein
MTALPGLSQFAPIDVDAEMAMIAKRGVLDLDSKRILAFAEGVITAAAVNPQASSQAQDWARLISGDPSKSLGDYRVVTLLLYSDMYNGIIADIRGGPHKYQPGFLDDAQPGEIVDLAREWASGFHSGTSLWPGGIEALIETRAGQDLLLPMVMFLYAKGADVPLVAEGRPDLDCVTLQNHAIGHLPAAICDIARFWLARGRKPKASLRQLGRSGRNDPCPCGSGQKFKKCCMRDDDQTH